MPDVIDPPANNLPAGRVAGPTQDSRRATVDARIRKVTSRQHGMITRRQLVDDVGLGVREIGWRLESCQLLAVHRGVYRLPGPHDPLGWAMAAALACGKGVVLSGRSAAAVHAIGDRGPRVEIAAPTQRRHAGIHCLIRQLAPDEMTVRFRVPVTTIARTVFDIAGLPDQSQAGLARLVNRARLADPRLLAKLERLIAGPSTPGSRVARSRLRAHLADMNGPIRSDFEKDFRQALAQNNLLPARFNVRVAGLEVDVLWPDAAVVVELDGRAYHDTERAFEEDRMRDARLAAHRYTVVRTTWRRWQTEPVEVLRQLQGIIRDHTPHA